MKIFTYELNETFGVVILGTVTMGLVYFSQSFLEIIDPAPITIRRSISVLILMIYVTSFFWAAEGAVKVSKYLSVISKLYVIM